MADWATISSLATAGGTLVLAVATFASVRSSNRSARMAERSLLAGLRPVLMPSRLQDPAQKVMFFGGHWVHIAGGCGVAEVADEVVFLAMSLRNAGNGAAVLHGWVFHAEMPVGDAPHADPRDFRRLTRDIVVPAADAGFWQGAFREAGSDEYAAARRVVEAHQIFGVELLYSDHEGGQRTISRFAFLPRQDDDAWLISVTRTWSLDRPGPR